MIKEKFNYLGEALNGRDIPDSLKRQGVALLGFFSSYKLLAEVSKPSGKIPDEFAPLVGVSLVFFLEFGRQFTLVMGKRVEKKVRTHLADKFPKLATIIRPK